MHLKDEEAFNDHAEKIRLNGVADVDKTLSAHFDDVQAHEHDEVLDKFCRFR